MKKIIIFKHHHYTRYYDASTKELIEKAYLHEFNDIKNNIYRPKEDLSEFRCEAYSKGPITLEKYNAAKISLDKVDIDYIFRPQLESLIKEYESELKDHKHYLYVLDLFDSVIKGERPKNKKGNIISLASIWYELNNEEPEIHDITEVK